LKIDILANDGSFAGPTMLTIFDSLLTNTTLKTLKLSHNNIGYDGAIVLREALKRNTGLTALDLSGIMNEFNCFRKSIGIEWGESDFGNLPTEYDSFQFETCLYQKCPLISRLSPQ
jgi:hypothetical protein